MNDWSMKKLVICEADDFCNDYERSGLNFLFYWKAKFPNFKITLFTIPSLTSPEFLDLLKGQSWLEFAVHGWTHRSNFEAYEWDYDKAKTLMSRIQEPYIKMYKSPGWTIYPELNGYPSAPEDPITKDPTAVYRALRDLDFIVVDRHYNKSARPADLKVICIDCNPNIVHTHTWNMMTPDPDSRNGFEQVEMRGVPWDNDTSFYTMGEAWEKGLIKPCQK